MKNKLFWALLALDLFLFCFVSFLYARTVFAQKTQSTPEERAKWPLPPDLVHFRSGGCTLYSMVKEEALNAKTGKLEPTLKVWAIQPYAEYDDNRANWTYVRKSGIPNVIGERKDGHDAWDLCQEWMAFAKAAADREKAKAGH